MESKIIFSDAGVFMKPLASRHSNPREKILSALSSMAYISGEHLAGELGMTRPAVWKYIVQLKQAGYLIESHPGKGYRLLAVPDILYPELIRRDLRTDHFGRQVYHFLRTDSTNSQARTLALKGAPNGSLVVAEHQEKGRGRLDRGWSSPPGKNLLFSIILRPTWPPYQAFYGTALASVALCQCLGQVAGIQAGIKWPNDIYVGHKKLAGILTEVATDLDRIEYLIVGVGINCHWAPEKTPVGAQPATSIKKETGRTVSRLELLTCFLRQAEGLFKEADEKGIDFLREYWNCYSLVTNRRVKIFNNQDVWNGVAQGIDEYGALMVLLENGRQETFLTGDVHLRF
jgi:BirA family transcriptional regulator, biotin operon repressor / biotin---[acetyl-CoA-carboxylase] ligase